MAFSVVGSCAVNDNTVWSAPPSWCVCLGTIAARTTHPGPGGLTLDRADLGRHHLGAGGVTHVLSNRRTVVLPCCRAAVLVDEVFGQFRVQRRLEGIVRELVHQAPRPDRAHTAFLGLRQQALCELLLIDNPPVTGSVTPSSNTPIVSATTTS